MILWSMYLLSSWFKGAKDAWTKWWRRRPRASPMPSSPNLFHREVYRKKCWNAGISYYFHPVIIPPCSVCNRFYADSGIFCHCPVQSLVTALVPFAPLSIHMLAVFLLLKLPLNSHSHWLILSCKNYCLSPSKQFSFLNFLVTTTEVYLEF
jgi:hypothetical protein